MIDFLLWHRIYVSFFLLRKSQYERLISFEAFQKIQARLTSSVRHRPEKDIGVDYLQAFWPAGSLLIGVGRSLPGMVQD